MKVEEMTDEQLVAEIVRLHVAKDWSSRLADLCREKARRRKIARGVPCTSTHE